MPNASDRPKSGPAAKKLGGSATATNDTPVSSVEGGVAAGRKKDPSPRKPADQGKARTGDTTPKDDHTEATGRDHPSQSEHAHQAYEKLHGVSDQRMKNQPAFKPPGKGKGGFDPKGFNIRQTRGANIPRKTQGK